MAFKGRYRGGGAHRLDPPDRWRRSAIRPAIRNAGFPGWRRDNPGRRVRTQTMLLRRPTMTTTTATSATTTFRPAPARPGDDRFVPLAAELGACFAERAAD